MSPKRTSATALKKLRTLYADYFDIYRGIEQLSAPARQNDPKLREESNTKRTTLIERLTATVVPALDEIEKKLTVTELADIHATLQKENIIPVA